MICRRRTNRSHQSYQKTRHNRVHITTKHEWDKHRQQQRIFITTIAECETGDEVYAYVNSGSCRLVPFDISDPDTYTSFSGSRISN